MRLHIFIILLFSVSACYSQVDSSYIGFYNQKLTLKGYINKDFIWMHYNMDEKDEIYMPNNPPSIGVGGSINNTVISLGYGYGFDFMRDKKRGKTESFDFQLHNYGRKFTFDLFIQKYKGFYIDNEDEKVPPVVCPDLSIRQYGVNVQYLFNNKKFSYRAAFDQSEKQLKSAGSILIGSGVYMSKISSDSSFVHNGENTLRNFQIGVSGGYTYTWVISPKWFINGSITAGINFGNEKFSQFGKQKVEVYPTVFPRLSAGYSRDPWALSFSYVNNMLFSAISSDSSIGLFSGSFRLTYTYRIQSVPILSKIFK